MRYHLWSPAPRETDLTECCALPRCIGRTRHSLLAFAFGMPLQTVFHGAPSPLFTVQGLSAQALRRYFCSSQRLRWDYSPGTCQCQVRLCLNSSAPRSCSSALAKVVGVM